MKFRKRITLAPGVRLNLSKRGVSTTVGPRGLNLNLGRKGAYLNTGIPGTGLYDRQRIGGASRRTSASSPPSMAALAFIDTEQAIKSQLWYRHFTWMLLAALVAWAFEAWLAITLASLAVAMFVARHVTPAGKARNAVLKARRQWQAQKHKEALNSLLKAHQLTSLPQLDRDIATAAMHTGDHNTAITHLQRITVPEPGDLIDLAASLLETGQHEQAAVIYRQLTHTLPQGELRESVMLRLAMSLYGAKQYRDALVAYQQVTPGRDNTNYLTKMIGICFYHKGDVQTAIFTMETAVGRKRNLDSDLLEMCYLLGLIHVEQKDTKKARHWLNKVYTRDINYKNVAQVLRELE